MTEQKQQANKITLVEGKLWKVIHAEGQGEKPSKGQEVSALYRGTLQNGQQFDSNQDRDEPFKFPLGQGRVIKGWDEGFASMRKGQKATLICSPQYAYGARGSPPKIPPNSTLHFEVELLDFYDKKKQKWQLSVEQKVQQATKLKNQGNQLLKNNQLSKAIAKYKEGIELVSDEDDEKAKGILKVLRMNASQANLKSKNYTEVIDLCSKVLKEDQNNIKTLYRRGVAYINNQDFDLAKTDIQKILKLEPSNADAQQQLIRIGHAKKAAAQKQKKLFGGMFSKSGLYEDKKPNEKKDKKKKEKDETDSQQQMPQLEKEEEDQSKKNKQESHHNHQNCSGHHHDHSHEHKHEHSHEHKHEQSAGQGNGANDHQKKD